MVYEHNLKYKNRFSIFFLFKKKSFSQKCCDGWPKYIIFSSRTFSPNVYMCALLLHVLLSRFYRSIILSILTFTAVALDSSNAGSQVFSKQSSRIVSPLTTTRGLSEVDPFPGTLLNSYNHIDPKLFHAMLNSLDHIDPKLFHAMLNSLDHIDPKLFYTMLNSHSHIDPKLLHTMLNSHILTQSYSTLCSTSIRK